MGQRKMQRYTRGLQAFLLTVTCCLVVLTAAQGGLPSSRFSPATPRYSIHPSHFQRGHKFQPQKPLLSSARGKRGGRFSGLHSLPKSQMSDDSNDPSRAALYKGMEARQDDEYVRLRVQHELHMGAMGGELIKVPLPRDKPVHILDSATGDGRWMKDAAAQYPRATFLGTDIIPRHFEQIKDMPPQVRFKIQSILEPWPAEDHKAFDLVHQRFGLASFKPELGKQATERLFGLVKPGGYIQMVDGDLLGFDGDKEHPAMAEMMRFMKRAFTQGGMNPVPGRSLEEWLTGAGARDVHVKKYEFGLGVKAETEERKTQTTTNIMGMIDNFSMIASSTPCLFTPSFSPARYLVLGLTEYDS